MATRQPSHVEDSLEALRRDWELLGRLDPLWAVVSDPRYQFGKWDIDTFFRTGSDYIAGIMARAGELGHPRERQTALDFGCGVGRLTRALGAYFEGCVGLDIAQSMIDKAIELNEDVPNCYFSLNAGPDLGAYPADRFDMVHSTIALQHIPDQPTILGFVAEFVRVVRPGGLIVFQLPSNMPWLDRLWPRRRAYELIRLFGASAQFVYRGLRLNPITMTALAESSVVERVAAAGGRVLDVVPDNLAGPRIESRTYFATK